MPQDETLRKRRSLQGFVDAVAEDLGDDARRAYRAFMARSVGGQKGARAGCTYYDGDELRPRSRPRRRLVPDRLRDPLRREEEVAPVAASPPPRPAADRPLRSTIDRVVK